MVERRRSTSSRSFRGCSLPRFAGELSLRSRVVSQLLARPAGRHRFSWVAAQLDGSPRPKACEHHHAGERGQEGRVQRLPRFHDLEAEATEITDRTKARHPGRRTEAAGLAGDDVTLGNERRSIEFERAWLPLDAQIRRLKNSAQFAVWSLRNLAVPVRIGRSVHPSGI